MAEPKLNDMVACVMIQVDLLSVELASEILAALSRSKTVLQKVHLERPCTFYHSMRQF